MTKLYIVGFKGKTQVFPCVVENNKSVKENLSYGGEATFRMYGDHGAVMDSPQFGTILTWDGRGCKATPYGKSRYGLK